MVIFCRFPVNLVFGAAELESKLDRNTKEEGYLLFKRISWVTLMRASVAPFKMFPVFCILGFATDELSVDLSSNRTY